MIRSWGQVTLTGNAQPLFGDVLTAALNNVKPTNGFYIVTVGSTTRYQVGDRIIVGLGSGNKTNCLLIGQVEDATHLYCTSEGDAPISAWAIGTLIALDIACAYVEIQSTLGNAGLIWLGSDSTVTNVGGGSAFKQITQAGSAPYGIPQWNTLRTNEFWFAGTLNDKAGVSAVVI
jgi:hypothetical protein